MGVKEVPDFEKKPSLKKNVRFEETEVIEVPLSCYMSKNPKGGVPLREVKNPRKCKHNYPIEKAIAAADQLAWNLQNSEDVCTPEPRLEPPGLGDDSCTPEKNPMKHFPARQRLPIHAWKFAHRQHQLSRRHSEGPQ